MNVGIITFHRTTNYGACLQALATQTILEKLGQNPTLIDYDPDSISLTYAHFSLKKYVMFVKQPKMMLRLIISDVRYAKINKQLDNAFASFYKKYYKLSPIRYKDYDSLKRNVPLIDVCITGSDQVWNCDITKGFDPAFFLKFGSKNMRRIAYAASLGRDDFSPSEQQEMFDLLDSFDAISIREENGADFLKKGTGKQVTICPDPTLLLNAQQWTDLFDIKRSAEKYIFVYALYPNPKLDEVVLELQRKTGLPIVRIGNRSVYDNEQTIHIADPCRYVELIANAEYVVTNSFHGTAFSINFSKTFWCILGESRNSRMQNLLEKVGLQSRAAHSFARIDVTEINYEKPQKKLNDYRTVGMNYLKEGLEITE